MKKCNKIFMSVLLVLVLSMFTACGRSDRAADETRMEKTDKNTKSESKKDTTEKSREEEIKENTTDDSKKDDPATEDGMLDKETDTNNNGDGTVSGELGNSVKDIGDGVGNAVEDMGDAVKNAADGR